MLNEPFTSAQINDSKRKVNQGHVRASKKQIYSSDISECNVSSRVSNCLSNCVSNVIDECLYLVEKFCLGFLRPPVSSI
jgi:hypothetical protein